MAIIPIVHISYDREAVRQGIIMIILMTNGRPEGSVKEEDAKAANASSASLNSPLICSAIKEGLARRPVNFVWNAFRFAAFVSWTT